MLDEYEGFKKDFLLLSGIDLNSYKETQMKRRILSFMGRHRCENLVVFFQLLKRDREVYNAFITYLTINVSEFYRNPVQWKTLESIIIPHIMKHSGSGIRVWSAACSTGDEPYSLAMVLSEFYPLERIEIIATDMDKEVLDKARQGCYHEKSLKSLPEKYQKRFFEKTDSGYYQVSDSLKRCITFREHNLLKDTYPGNLDLVVCRNVMIYFTEEAKDRIYKGISQSLKKDGVLFVGSTEQIIGSDVYGLETFQSFFYKKI